MKVRLMQTSKAVLPTRDGEISLDDLIVPVLVVLMVAMVAVEQLREKKDSGRQSALKS